MSGGATIVSLNSASTCACKSIKGEGIRWLGFIFDFGRLAWLRPSGFPLSRECREKEGGNDGVESGNDRVESENERGKARE